MNEQQSTFALESFINDFELTAPDGVTSFNAAIHLFFNGRLETFESNVQAILSDALNTLYILDADYLARGLPEMFDPANNAFTYVKNGYLRIVPVNDLPNTVIAIFPKKQ